MSRKRYSRRARAKRRIRIGLITAAVLLLLFLLFFGFGIRSCEITGNYHNSDAEISEMVFQGLSRRSAVLLGLTRGNYVPKDSRAVFIDHIEVRTTGAASVRVRVVEKPVVGYLQYEGRYWFFDREGVVLVCSEYTENELRAMAENTSSEEAPAPEAEEGEIEPESRLAGLSSGRTGFAVAMTGADAEDEEEDPEEEDEEESDEEEESSEDEEDSADEEEDPSEDGGEDTDGESEDEEEDEDSEEEEEEEEDGDRVPGGTGDRRAGNRVADAHAGAASSGRRSELHSARDRSSDRLHRGRRPDPGAEPPDLPHGGDRQAFRGYQ